MGKELQFTREGLEKLKKELDEADIDKRALTKKLNVKVHEFSASAIEKITAAGGQAERLD